MGTYISLPSVLRCAAQVVQLPCRKRMAMAFSCSPAARLKNVRGLLMVNFHRLGPSGVAMAAASAEPQVKGAWSQLEGLVLKLVMAPRCTYTLPVKPIKPWLPLVASTVMVTTSLSLG